MELHTAYWILEVMGEMDAETLQEHRWIVMAGGWQDWTRRTRTLNRRTK